MQRMRLVYTIIDCDVEPCKTVIFDDRYFLCIRYGILIVVTDEICSMMNGFSTENL